MTEEQLFEICRVAGVHRNSDAWRRFVAWQLGSAPHWVGKLTAAEDTDPRAIRALWWAFASGHDMAFVQVFTEMADRLAREAPCQRCAAFDPFA